MKKWYWFLVVIVGVILDVATKLWADNTLNYGESVVLTPFFNWTLLYNKGAAFSFLASFGGWQRWLFTTVSIMASVFITIWMLRTDRDKPWLLLGLSLVLSGAIGNLWDRVRFGYVIDFIHFHYANYHWPVFNVADIFVSIGIGLILLLSIFETKK